MVPAGKIVPSLILHTKRLVGEVLGYEKEVVSNTRSGLSDIIGSHNIEHLYIYIYIYTYLYYIYIINNIYIYHIYIIYDNVGHTGPAGFLGKAPRVSGTGALHGGFWSYSKTVFDIFEINE